MSARVWSNIFKYYEIFQSCLHSTALHHVFIVFQKMAENFGKGEEDLDCQVMLKYFKVSELGIMSHGLVYKMMTRNFCLQFDESCSS